MKTVRNKTRRPLRIPIPGGKFLHLGPAKTGQIADKTAGAARFQKMVAAGEIEVLGEGPSSQAGGGKDSGGHEATHGHPQQTVVLPKGNR